MSQLAPSLGVAPVDLFNDELDALVRLAAQDAWQAYAWHRAQQLEQHWTGFWVGLPAALTAAMHERKCDGMDQQHDAG